MAQVQEALQKQAIRPMVLTHGTLEIRDVQKSRHFYRDFFGMEVVQHVPLGCRVSLGGEFYNWWEIQCYEGDARETHLQWGQTVHAKTEQHKNKERAE